MALNIDGMRPEFSQAASMARKRTPAGDPETSDAINTALVLVHLSLKALTHELHALQDIVKKAEPVAPAEETPADAPASRMTMRELHGPADRCREIQREAIEMGVRVVASPGEKDTGNFWYGDVVKPGTVGVLVSGRASPNPWGAIADVWGAWTDPQHPLYDPAHHAKTNKQSRADANTGGCPLEG